MMRLKRDFLDIGENISLDNGNYVECVTLLQKSNRKLRPDSYVKLSLDMEDYYRIKDAEGGTEIE